MRRTDMVRRDRFIVECGKEQVGLIWNTGRTDSNGGSGNTWSSPGRLMRSLSNNALAHAQNTTATSTAEGNSSNAGSKQDAPAIDPLSQVNTCNEQTPSLSYCYERTKAPPQVSTNADCIARNLAYPSSHECPSEPAYEFYQSTATANVGYEWRVEG